MFDRTDIRAAVEAGAISDDAAKRLEAFLKARNDPERMLDPENLRFLSNFNDVFLTIGIVVLMTGLGFLSAITVTNIFALSNLQYISLARRSGAGHGHGEARHHPVSSAGSDRGLAARGILLRAAQASPAVHVARRVHHAEAPPSSAGRSSSPTRSTPSSRTIHGTSLSRSAMRASALAPLPPPRCSGASACRSRCSCLPVPSPACSTRRSASSAARAKWLAGRPCSGSASPP